MSNVRVMFAEMAASDETMRAVIVELAERVKGAASPGGSTVELPVPGSVGRLPAAPAMRKGTARRGQRQGEASADARIPKTGVTAKGQGALELGLRELLAKRPMSSGELLASLKGQKAGSIYDRLSRMRKEGRIRMEEDPETGQQRNVLVK